MNSSDSSSSFPIVGVGASAGGLEAINAFFSCLPADTPCAFVLIQHLSPDFKSYMSEILSRETDLNVVEAANQMEIQPRSIYILQPRTHIVLNEGKLEVIAKSRSTDVKDMPINRFMASLAKECGSKGAAVILSGTGSDGAIGCQKVRAVGGTVLVQDPKTAGFNGMPHAAIAAGTVDHIASPAALAARILALNYDPPTRVPQEAKQDVSEYLPVFDLISTHVNIDLSLYKPGTISRCIDRRIAHLKLDNISTYLDLLKQNPDEVIHLYYYTLIGTTHFFRDTSAYRIIEDEIIPKILENKPRGHEVRVWSAGVATGQEVYSLAMLFSEAINLTNKNLQLRIFATDVNERFIAKASEGVFNELDITGISEHLKARYFIREHNSYRVIPELRQRVVFAKHNLLTDPPFSNMDLASCRNLLIYFKNDGQQQALAYLLRSLSHGAYLFLGSADSPGAFIDTLEPISNKWKIYRKIKNISRQRFPVPNVTGRAKPQSPLYRPATITAYTERTQALELNDVLRSTLHQILTQGFLVNKDLDIIYSFGAIEHLMRIRTGAPAMNIESIIEKNLSTIVLVLVRRCLREKAPITSEKNKVFNLGKNYVVDIIVTPITLEKSSSTYVLIEFRDSDEAKVSSAQTSIGQSSEEIVTLQQELQLTRENLRTTIQELECTNQDLQMANEELMSSNEELQATNEELHSLNEELQTVNAEHQYKIDELVRLQRDEENLLRATDMGILFLDDKLQVRKFTPSVANSFHLIPQDIGRPLAHINHNIKGVDLLTEAANVIESGNLFEKEVSSQNTTPYLMRIVPYAAENNKISGVVINFIDITAVQEAELTLKTQKEALQKQKDYLHRLQELVNDGFWDWHLKDDHEYMSPRFWEILGYDPETKQHHPNEWRALIHPEDMDVVVKNLNLHIESKGEYPFTQEVRYWHQHNRWIWILFRGQVISWDDQGQALRMVGTHTNIDALKRLAERDRLVTKGTSVGIWDWINIHETHQEWSPRFYELLGYNVGEVLASTEQFQELIHPDDKPSTLAAIEAHLKNDVPFDVEYRLKTRSGAFRWFRGSGLVARDPAGQPQRMVGSILDIHEKKTMEVQLRSSNENLAQYAYVASHDLKTPVRTIASFFSLLKEGLTGKLTSEQKHYAQRIESAAEYMTDMLENLLTLSTVEGPSLPLELVDPTALVHNLLSILSLQIKSHNVEVTIHSVPEVMADPKLLSQVFQNLIDNCIRYRSHGSSLKIDIQGEVINGLVQIKFKDNGRGVHIQEKERIFEAFHRSELKIKKAFGNGIGLAFCRRALHRMTGRIWLESSTPEGSVFIMELQAQSSQDQKLAPVAPETASSI